MNVNEFASRVKKKYPEYNDIDDAELTKLVLEKYPEYKDDVQFEKPPMVKEDTSMLLGKRPQDEMLQQKFTFPETSITTPPVKKLPQKVKEKVQGIFRPTPAIERAKAQAAYSIAEVIDKSPSEVLKDLPKYTKDLGLRQVPTTEELLTVAATLGAGMGAFGKPVVLVGRLAMFKAIDEVDNLMTSKLYKEPYKVGGGKKILKKVIPVEKPGWENIEKVVDVADMVLKAVAVGQLSTKGKEFILRSTIKKYKMPKTVHISGEKIKSIFQTGEKISPAERELVASVIKTGKGWQAAIKNGIDIEVPSEKLLIHADRLWFAKLKSAFKIKPYKVVKKAFAGKPKEILKKLVSPKGIIEKEVSILNPLRKKYGAETLTTFVKLYGSKLRDKFKRLNKAKDVGNQEFVVKLGKEVKDWTTDKFKEIDSKAKYVKNVECLKGEISELKVKEQKVLQLESTETRAQRLNFEGVRKNEIELSRKQHLLAQIKDCKRQCMFMNEQDVHNDFNKTTLPEHIPETASKVTEGMMKKSFDTASHFMRLMEWHGKLPWELKQYVVGLEQSAEFVQQDSINTVEKLLGSDLLKDPKKLREFAMAIEYGKPVPVGTEQAASNVITWLEDASKWMKKKGYIEREFYEKMKQRFETILRDVNLDSVSRKGIEAKVAELKLMKHYLPLEIVQKEGALKALASIKRMVMTGKFSMKVLERTTISIREAEEIYGKNRVEELPIALARVIEQVKTGQMLSRFTENIVSNKELCSDYNKVVGRDEYVKLDPSIFPEAKGKYFHPAIADAMNYLTEQTNSNDLVIAYDKVNAVIKIMNFYVMTMLLKNNVQQMMVVAGIRGFANLPKALLMVMRGHKIVRALKIGGLGNTPLLGKSDVKNNMETVLDIIRKTKGERYVDNIKGWIGRPDKFIMDVWHEMQHKAWTYCDLAIRVASYLGCEKEFKRRGLSLYQGIECINRAHVPYSFFKKKLKKIANRALFVPTYRIWTMHYMAGILRHPIKKRRELFRLMILTAVHAFGVGAAIEAGGYIFFDKKYKVKTEGHQIRITETGKNDIILSHASPFLEWVKITSRHPVASIYYNLAAIPKMISTAVMHARGMNFPKTQLEKWGSLLPLGIPILRDWKLWHSLDKNTFMKFMEQMGWASFYETQHYKDPSSDAHRIYRVVEALGYIPFYFKNKEMRQMKHALETYKFYKSKINLCLYEGDWDRLNGYLKKIKEDHGYDIFITPRDYKRAVKTGILKSMHTRDEWFEKKLPRVLKMHLSRAKELGMK